MSRGAHLATYNNLAEQKDVEKYYVELGGILPGFHTFYWIGLTTENWPEFYWADMSPMKGNISETGHWGYFMPQNILEPNNIYPPENCVGANLTESFDGAWGWADTRCSQRWPGLCRIVPPGIWHYKSPSTNYTYAFNNSAVNQQDAELGCQDAGGHLVTWTSLEEQIEVEEYFVSKGILIPGFHKSYWAGLRSSSWPYFQWMDRTTNIELEYTHWGTNGDIKEPNNLNPPEMCGAANYTQRYGGAWGWSDTACSSPLVFICRLLKPGNFTITSAVTGNNFTFFTETKNYTNAKEHCISMGQHLVSFENLDEQAEVEAGLILSGFLLPGFQRLYWLGLTATLEEWPFYRWNDRSLKGPGGEYYEHWGKTKVGNFAFQEPKSNSELCSCSAKQQAFGFPSAWGWVSQLCSFEAVYMCRGAANTAFSYNTSKGVTFIFNSTLTTQADAEQSCKDNGGHLASYLSGPEQAEVENYFSMMGFLMPTFHLRYWIGAVSSPAHWPSFKWIDQNPGINMTTYQLWGKLGMAPEPNNAPIGNEFCAVANYSQSYGNPRKWGWSDTNCDYIKAPFMCRMLPPLVKFCKSETTGNDYILNTNRMGFDDAMAVCNSCGGLLVSYDNFTEQREVERCFQDDGWLLPNYHKFYWMGLASNVNGAIWPNFTWLDHGKAIYQGNYQHWGTIMPGRILEPNNLVPPEVCAGSNLTAGIIRHRELIYDGVGGWADHNCQEQYVFICEVLPPQKFGSYVSVVSGYEFTLYTTPMNHSAAEVECNANGGHLASYASQAEQVGRLQARQARQAGRPRGLCEWAAGRRH
jgi:hypothetical protein